MKVGDQPLEGNMVEVTQYSGKIGLQFLYYVVHSFTSRGGMCSGVDIQNCNEELGKLTG